MNKSRSNAKVTSSKLIQTLLREQNFVAADVKFGVCSFVAESDLG